MNVINGRKQPVPSDAIYIGRGSPFGNPYVLGKDGDRDTVIKKFEAYAKQSPILLNHIYHLPSDAVLKCFCKPADCHGDVIIRLWKFMHL